MPKPLGTVAIIGAGPGDPELLTLKAHRLLQAADAVVYDRLVDESILACISPAAERIYSGKSARRHHKTQDEINTLLVRLAREGKRVVRLKGGDPLVFGRCGEEMEALDKAGVCWELVPGVSAANGCAAALGIPLTHRELSSSIHFITGHCRKEAAQRQDWGKLADPDKTLVIYMGLATLKEITAQLIAAGLDAATPAIAVQEGTTAQQRVAAAPLAMLADKVAQAGLEAPVLVIIGKVVALSPAWRAALAE